DVAVDLLADRLAVDGHADGTAQAGVLQRRIGQVESERDLGGQRREAAAPEVTQRLRHGVRRDIPDVDPPRPEVAEGRRRGPAADEADGGYRRERPPVVLRALQDEVAREGGAGSKRVGSRPGWMAKEGCGVGLE